VPKIKNQVVRTLPNAYNHILRQKENTIMIEIGEYRIIKADPLNWSIDKSNISEKGKTKGKMVWRSIGYYYDLSQGLISFHEALIKDGYGDTESIEDLMDLITDAKLAIIESVKEMNNGSI